jgi:hypothetical protein
MRCRTVILWCMFLDDTRADFSLCCCGGLLWERGLSVLSECLHLFLSTVVPAGERCLAECHA